jgi:hypothetical protein
MTVHVSLERQQQDEDRLGWLPYMNGTDVDVQQLHINLLAFQKRNFCNFFIITFICRVLHATNENKRNKLSPQISTPRILMSVSCVHAWPFEEFLEYGTTRSESQGIFRNRGSFLLTRVIRLLDRMFLFSHDKKKKKKNTFSIFLDTFVLFSFHRKNFTRLSFACISITSCFRVFYKVMKKERFVFRCEQVRELHTVIHFKHLSSVSSDLVSHGDVRTACEVSSPYTFSWSTLAVLVLCSALL